MKQPVVYIAGPFRGATPWVVEQNIRRAEELSLQVWQAGGAALCPHTNTRFFDRMLPDAVFLEGTLAMLAKCDALITLPTWQLSEGARAEVAYALRHDIQVVHGIEDLIYWIEVGCPKVG